MSLASAANATIALNRCHFPVTSLGYGRRVGVWMQGCSIHCAGCLVPETWEAHAEHVVPVSRLLAALERWLPHADGVTISGGEPFDQPEALRALIDGIRARTAGDVLVYSGYPARLLESRHATVLHDVDVLISEPFVARLEDERGLTGSANQRIHLLSPLARARYSAGVTAHRGLDLAVEGNRVFFAGVPARGVLRRLAEHMSDDGVEARLTHAPV